MASAVAVIGAQWGDEAQGKIVHFLSREADFCVRFNGALERLGFIRSPPGPSIPNALAMRRYFFPRR